MKVTVKVDYSRILTMARELQRYSPLPHKRIVLMETASIIKIAALRANIASAPAIKKAALDRMDTAFETADGSLLTINVHKNKGRTWFVPGDKTRDRGPGGTFSMVYDVGPSRGHHLQDFYWAAYQLAVGDKVMALKILTVELLRRRGLMRLSWIQMGDELGVPLYTVSPQGNLQERVARAARGPKGRTYRNGTAQVTITPRHLIIRLRNESPLAIKNRGQAELDRAAVQRLKGFELAVAHDVFSNLKLSSARWKGIVVRQR
jgi:hypothetical protein